MVCEEVGNKYIMKYDKTKGAPNECCLISIVSLDRQIEILSNYSRKIAHLIVRFN